MNLSRTILYGIVMCVIFNTVEGIDCMKYSFKAWMIGHIFHSVCKKEYASWFVKTLADVDNICDFRYSVKPG